MKNKNMRELEKHWAEQREKAAKPPKPAKPAGKKKSREDVTQANSKAVPEAPKN